jgi:23S rRNA (cytidine2498-2'-O)-methyltransferase
MPERLSSPHDLLLCRPGAEPELLEECLSRHGVHGHTAGPGLIMLNAGKLPEAPLIFERQRMPEARLLTLPEGAHIQPGSAEALWASWSANPMPWGMHLIAAEEESGGLARRLQGVAREFIRLGEAALPGLRKWERKPEKLLRDQKGMIFQLLLCREGLWVSAAPAGRLTAPVPGGRFRMKMDPEAPSRSYLKMEEALMRLGIEPLEDERVIDLGAAPGGWTYAFAKRGCFVTAVDNGPLKLSSAAVRRVEHLHRDGLTFKVPPHLPPVDWLVGDMLIPPGKAFGVLKYWVGGKHCRRLILNIKLPQEQPFPALQPILDWIEPRGTFSVRQLYHDRREVTVFGTLI